MVSDIASYDFVWACRLPHKALLQDMELRRRLKPPTPIEPCYLWGMHFLRTNWGVITEGNEYPQFMLVYYRRKTRKRITNNDCLDHFKGLPRWPVKQE